MALRSISLCSGVGGLDIGVGLALGGLRHLCYVERELSAARVLAQRMEDGALVNFSHPLQPISAFLLGLSVLLQRGIATMPSDDTLSRLRWQLESYFGGSDD
ncbi:MAG: hypothetical protein ABFD89_05895 [Bryobacteraceae bacterium]